MLIRYRLKYVGKGWAWLDRARAHRSCRGYRSWNSAQGGFIRKGRHRLVVLDPESSANGDTWRNVSCICGQISGNYVKGRDDNNILFEREAYVEHESDIEAAEIARRMYEDEYIKQVGGGRWEWTTTDDEPGIPLADGSVLAARKRVFVMSGSRNCTCGHAGPQHESDRAIGWGRCMWVEVGRTNDGLDEIKARCSCQRYEPTRPAKLMTTDVDAGRIIRPQDWNEYKADWEAWPPARDGRWVGVDEADPAGDTTVIMRPGTVQPIPVIVESEGVLVRGDDPNLTITVEDRKVLDQKDITDLNGAIIRGDRNTYARLKAKVLELRQGRRDAEVKSGTAKRARREDGLV